MRSRSFHRLLVARRLPEYDCWAEDGEWLAPAPEGTIPPFRLPPGAHFFVGLTSRRSARYGFVTELTTEVDPASVARAIGAGTDLRLVREYLEAVAKEPPGTVMAVSWKRRGGLLSGGRRLTVHLARLGRPAADPRRPL